MIDIPFRTETGLKHAIEIDSVIRDYKFEKTLNSGAYSAVVLVRDLNTDQLYAGKIIPTLSIENKDQMHLIEKEIDILSKLSHPNVIKLISTIEFVNKNNEKFIILIEELCSHGDLITYVTSQGFKSKAEIRQISRGITEAIAYIHDEGIAHCDIKPENILLTENNIPKICDFNLSKYMDNINQSDRSCTLAYSAPEIHICMPIDFFKADVWSLGITIFAISELRFPYHSIYEALEGNLYYTTNSRLLDKFVRKCLNYNPSERPSPKELLDELYLNLEYDDSEDITKIISSASKESLLQRKTNQKILNDTQKVQKHQKIYSFQKVRYDDQNDQKQQSTQKVQDDDQNAQKQQSAQKVQNNDQNDQKQQSDELKPEIDMNITLELGFDFSFQEYNDNESEFSAKNEPLDKKLSNYLEFNYSDIMSEENKEFYEYERYEDRICANLLKIRYQKKPKKKKGKKVKHVHNDVVDNDNDNDNDDFC